MGSWNIDTVWTGVDPNRSEYGNTSDLSVGSLPERDDLARTINGWLLAIIVLYVVVCCFGILTNGLVIYVIIVASKAATVTNLYVLNLAVSDFLFLAGVPFTVVTAVERMWIFGGIMCKIFWATTSINWFTSIYTLTVLSADRYFAICHAFWSIPYRTPTVARLVCVGIWTVSLVVMLPIIVHGRTAEVEGRVSCTVDWPENDLNVDPYHVFIGYSFSLGYAVPIGLITVFYSLVVLRLKGARPNCSTSTKRTRSQRAQTRVTLMVTLVTAVNVICWLPYWIFQLLFLFAKQELSSSTILAYQLITVMNYANSAVNPVLYAFLSESFVKSLYLAFGCCPAVTADFATGDTYKGHGSQGPGRGRGSRGRRRRGLLAAVVDRGGRTCSVVLASEGRRLSRASRRLSEREQLELNALTDDKSPTKEQIGEEK